MHAQARAETLRALQGEMRVFVAPVGGVIYDDQLVGMAQVDADLLTEATRGA